MGNRMLERFKRTLMNMMGTLEPLQKSSWRDYIAPMVQTYNCTCHESTGAAPYFLMFRQYHRLQLDLAFGQYKNKKTPMTKYVQNPCDRLA